MKTLLLTLAIILPANLARADRSNPDMDDSLDRSVSLAEARGAIDAPKAPKLAPKPASAKPAPVAGVLTAVCNDGLSYYSATGEHRGACSGHHGVASWTDGSPVKSKVRTTSYR